MSMNNLSAELYAATPSERTQLPSGTNVLSFRATTHSGYGENRLATFWTVKLFGKLAETLEVPKGQRMFISGGEVRVREFTRKDGETKGYSPEILLGMGSNITLIDRKLAVESGAREAAQVEEPSIPDDDNMPF